MELPQFHLMGTKKPKRPGRKPKSIEEYRYIRLSADRSVEGVPHELCRRANGKMDKRFARAHFSGSVVYHDLISAEKKILNSLPRRGFQASIEHFPDDEFPT